MKYNRVAAELWEHIETSRPVEVECLAVTTGLTAVQRLRLSLRVLRVLRACGASIPCGRVRIVWSWITQMMVSVIEGSPTAPPVVSAGSAVTRRRAGS